MEGIKKELSRVINEQPLLISLIAPVIVVLLLNLGLICNLCLWLNFEPIKSIVSYLSIKNDYEFPPDYFVGIITIFILFFSFAQFSYSRQNLPANLVRKHILAHRNTKMFIGFQFSFSSIIAFFSFINLHSIYNLNFIIILLIILSSVLLSILYFYWLVKNVTSVGMFEPYPKL